MAWIFATFILAFGLASAPIKAQALEKISAGYGAISGSSAPIWVAKEARLFEKYGLEVDLVYIPGPRNIMALVGGSINLQIIRAYLLWNHIKGVLTLR